MEVAGDFKKIKGVYYSRDKLIHDTHLHKCIACIREVNNFKITQSAVINTKDQTTNYSQAKSLENKKSR